MFCCRLNRTGRRVRMVWALVGCLALWSCELDGVGGSRSGIVPVERVPAVGESATVAPPPPLPNAAVQAARASEGAVTVYDLEGDAAAVPGDIKAPLALQSAADPSVDVYPLDYGRADPGTRWAGSGILMPSGRDAMAGRVLEPPARSGGPESAVGATDMAPARVFFGHGSSQLTPAARKVLTELADWSRRTGGAILVEGHASARAGMTDPVGRETVNLKQSLDRAYAVSRELLRLGVTSDRVRTTGFGDSRPAVSEPGRSAEAASRRVEVYTEGQFVPARL